MTPFPSLLQERASEFDDIDAQIEVDDGEQCLMHTVSYTSRMQPLIWTYGMHQFFCFLLGMSCLSLSLRYLAAHLHVRAKQLFNIHVQCMKLSGTQSTYSLCKMSHAAAACMLPIKVQCACLMHTKLFMPVVCTQMCLKTGVVPCI